MDTIKNLKEHAQFVLKLTPTAKLVQMTRNVAVVYPAILLIQMVNANYAYLTAKHAKMTKVAINVKPVIIIINN